MTHTAYPAVLVLGSINVDHVVRVDRMPGPGETLTGGPVAQLLGGKGANQAVASARLGRTTRFFGAVGSDPSADDALQALSANGVDISGCQAVSGQTGSAMVIVDSRAENMIVVSPGANGAVDESFADAACSAGAAQDVLLLQLEVPMSTVERAAATCSALVVLNPAPARPLPARLWSEVDVLVVNESELFLVAEHDGADVRAAMASLPVRRVITTLGAQGCLVRDGDRWWSVEAPVVDAIDTTGAGDCFCGVLADGLAQTMSLPDAAARATIAAALSTTVAGAQSSPTVAQLETATLTAPVRQL